jgi:hypothetical protein
VIEEGSVVLIVGLSFFIPIPNGLLPNEGFEVALPPIDGKLLIGFAAINGPFDNVTSFSFPSREE